MKPIPVNELDPAYDTAPHKGALRRAGVRDDVIEDMPQGSVVARGTLLMRAEDALKASAIRLQQQVDRLVSHNMPPMIGAAEAVAVNAGYLAGLRQGIEFTTGGVGG